MNSSDVASGEQRHELFRQLVEGLPDCAIVLLDASGRITSWNAGAQRIMRCRAEEVLGAHYSIFHPADAVLAGRCETELDTATNAGSVAEDGWRIRKDGTRFWANTVITAIRDVDGHTFGFSLVAHDLSDRQRIQDEQVARLLAENASRAKDEFLAVLGHELRNPMAPILTALQLIKLHGGQAGTRELEVIERQVRHMMRLLDDLLDIDRIVNRKLVLNRQRIDLRDAIAHAVDATSALFEARRHQFSVVVPAQVIDVDGDEERLIQVFTNLLKNAALYTHAGGTITLAARVLAREVAVEITDDGRGIEPELLPRVFDRFVQGERDRDRLYGGLGLGLSLVRTLVELHGGRASAHSRGRGRGSTFTVTLPLEGRRTSPEPTQLPPPSATRTPRAARILVVDDNEDARLLLVEVLESFGHAVRGAADATEALALLSDFQPDVAILDIGLPIVDGYELAARIRTELGARAPRFVALTGYGLPQDHERSAAAGFAHHVVKPVDFRSLNAILDTLLEAPSDR